MRLYLPADVARTYSDSLAIREWYGANVIAQSLDQLVTPALLLDLDLFESNLKQLTGVLRENDCGFRPHAKTHKCPEIARRQLQAGARGISVSTVGEAEAMVAAGLPGVLLTSPVVSPGAVRRMVNLAGHAPDVMVVVDHPTGVKAFEAAAAAAGVEVTVLVDLDVGDHRTGIEPGPPAIALARQVADAPHLRFAGLQAYSGSSSHTVGHDARAGRSQKVMARAVRARELIENAGLTAGILSGGSTGTYDIDSAIDGVTELQVGSFVLMDLDYRRIGSRTSEQFTDFGLALTVLSSVVSANHSDRVTIDAGTKAFSTETRIPPQPVGLDGVRYTRGGDEFGILHLDEPSRPLRLGDRIRFYAPHCDPTVNLYDRLHCHRGEQIVGVWPIVARRGA